MRHLLKRLRRHDAPHAAELTVDEVLARLPPERTEELVMRLAQRQASYAGDGLVTFHHSDFLADSLFQEAYRLGRATGSWRGADIAWRAYVACWAASKGKHLEGDFVECGVERGGLARTVMHYVGFEQLDKKFFLLDTFCGFPPEHRPLAAQCHLESYNDCYADACRTFAGIERAILIRGKVPDTLARVDATKVCYLSIDMNCAEPEIAAAAFFWDRLVSGAVIVLDDYGYSDHYLRQKHAFDRFARERSVQVLLLPTGQGLIFKP